MPPVFSTRSCWLSPLPDQIVVSTTAKQAEIMMAGHQRGLISVGISSMGSCSSASSSGSSMCDTAMV